METETSGMKESRGLGFFEKYLYVWVILCILAGIILGKGAPGVAKYLDGLAIYVGEAPVVVTFPDGSVATAADTVANRTVIVDGTRVKR